jgi:acyl-CoA thioester hydrolase
MKLKPFCRKANFYETDQMGIIHHSNYIRWFEEARVDYLQQIGYGYEKAIERGIDFGVISVYCEYKSMLRFGDTVNIHVTLSELSNMKMTIKYEMINARSGEVCTTGNSKHFFYDNNKQRPVSLKKEMPELFELFSSLMA